MAALVTIAQDAETFSATTEGLGLGARYVGFSKATLYDFLEEIASRRSDTEVLLEQHRMSITAALTRLGRLCRRGLR